MFVVTGGAGFIGSAFVAKLNEEDCEEILIVDELGDSSKWQNLVGKAYLDYLHKDAFLPALAQGKFKGNISGIVHMGACSSTTETDADFLLENNFRYTQQLAEHCLERNIRFIYASSAATYGDGSLGYSDADDDQETFRPLNRYGYSKQLFDLWAIRNNVQNDLVGLKFFNVYGPNEYHKGSMQSVVHRAYHQVKNEGSVKLFRSYRPDYKDGEQKRDFIYVKDCVEVMWWLLNHSNTNGIFNLGTGKARSWNELASGVFAALGKDPNIEYIDMPENLRHQYQYFTEATMTKLEESGCPLPHYSLEEGIQDYVQQHLEKEWPYY